MSSFCLLHKDPVGTRQAFSVLPTPDPAPIEFAATRRVKIWELSPWLHCSIIGTCLTAADRRLFCTRCGAGDARAASDHELHGRGVTAASRRDDGGKLLNKAL